MQKIIDIVNEEFKERKNLGGNWEAYEVEEYLEEIQASLISKIQAINVIQCCKSDSEQLKASFQKGDTVLLDNSQKVIYIEDLQNDEIMLRHIAGYKFIVNAFRVSSL